MSDRTTLLRRLPIPAWVHEHVTPLARNLPRPGAGRSYRRFVILAPARSGSTMLMQRCQSHPQLRCYGELLNSSLHSFPDPARHLRRQAWNHHRNTIRAVGFKLLYSHYARLRDDLLPILCGDAPLPIIRLERRDLLAMYLSWVRTQETGVYHVTDPRHLTAPPARRIDLVDLERFLHDHHGRCDLAARDLAGNPVLDLVYEDVLADPTASDRAICDFLGVPHKPLSEKILRTGIVPPRDLVENLDEVLALLQAFKAPPPVA